MLRSNLSKAIINHHHHRVCNRHIYMKRNLSVLQCNCNASYVKNTVLKVAPLQALLQSPITITTQQRRNYIFVPSISEIYKSIYESSLSLFEAEQNKHQNRKFLIIQKTKFQKKYKTICDHYTNKQIHQRLVNYNHIFKSRFTQQRLIFNNYMLRKKGVMQHYKTRSRLRYHKYKERYYNRYLNGNREEIIQVIPMDEPIENAWFDEEGYPLTARDKITGRFVNPWQSKTGHGTHKLWTFLTWKWQRFWRNTNTNAQQEQLTTSNDNKGTPLSLSSLVTSSSSLPVPPSIQDKVKLVWIGHSTCFVQMNSFTILTDPMFSHRASLFQWTGGVARSVPPSHSIQNNDHDAIIDIVVISHDHYDHLDYDSILALLHKVQYWCVPLGMKQWLIENIPGMIHKQDNIIDLEWWQSVTLCKDYNGKVLQNINDTHDSNEYEEIKVTCAPAHHWSCRTPFDRNLRLWCSWALTSSNNASKQLPLSFYFAGDTAYPQFPLHSLITNKLGPFDLSAIPIGAYEPSFFMKDSHCNPNEALKIHKALNSKKSVAIHWGTFPLADESINDPPVVLRKALENEQNGQKDAFVVVRHGEEVLSN